MPKLQRAFFCRRRLNSGCKDDRLVAIQVCTLRSPFGTVYWALSRPGTYSRLIFLFLGRPLVSKARRHFTFNGAAQGVHRIQIRAPADRRYSAANGSVSLAGGGRGPPAQVCPYFSSRKTPSFPVVRDPPARPYRPYSSAP